MEEQSSSKKIIIIVSIVVVLLIVLVVGYFLLKGGKSSGTGTTSFGALFGISGEDGTRPTSTKVTGIGGEDGGGDLSSGGDSAEPLFRQLANIQVAGATAVEKGGKTFVRYIARENGFIYDVDPKTGATVQITNTMIPRIYEAYWAENGNTVVLRYLKHDDLSRKDIIKTQIADLVLPSENTDGANIALGSLSIPDPQLPDNIASVSVSPNGTRLFYLLPVTDGVSGTVVNIATKAGTEVFRNSFSEWLSQMLDSGNVILTTKASANVPGYSYFYDANKKTLARIVREKKGLTTLTTPLGERMLYSENLLGNTILGLYDKKGFPQDEGEVSHTAPLQLATLPEKCTWSGNRVRVYCGAFASTPHAQIPDDWYQGSLAFSDTFWTINTDLSDLVFLADPMKETGKTFDVFIPFVDKGEDHFYFVDKNDSTLWSMRLEKAKYATPDESPMVSSSTLPALTPEELRDAVGSLPATATTAPPKLKK
jgi:hypothetical protein